MPRVPEIMLVSLSALAAMSGCGARRRTLPPHGEVLVYVDTDLSVPQLASRLRVDVFGPDGVIDDTRDLGLPSPRDWPTSFGITSDDESRDKTVVVRLRVYPEGYLRELFDDHAEAKGVYVEPPVPHDEGAMCDGAPSLSLGDVVTVRSARAPFIRRLDGGPSCDKINDVVGSNAASIQVTAPGDYTFGVLATFPDRAQVTLQLRRACADDRSFVACETGLSADFTTWTSPTMTVSLGRGTYWLVTGSAGASDAPIDITLGASSKATWGYAPPERPKRDEPPRWSAKYRTGAPYLPNMPKPGVTIDRLLRVVIHPDVQSSVHVMLRGDCVGRRAFLGEGSVQLDRMRTCIDGSNLDAPLITEAPSDDGRPPSQQGSFGVADSCPKADPESTMVCVTGGAFVFGSTDGGGRGEASSTPERTVVVPSFRIDRHEVTVAAYRAARDGGFSPSRPLADGPFTATTNPLCTWTARAGTFEDYALDCITWYGAREFCRSLGGDLPTEAQWEYVATMAGRAFKTRYPWGDDPPRCDCASSTEPCHAPIYGRSAAGVDELNQPCFDPSRRRETTMASPVTASEGEHGDVTPLGVVGLAGGVSEFTLDAFHAFDDACWNDAETRSPTCWEDEATRRTERGGYWVSLASGMLSAMREGVFPGHVYPFTGFRCAYPGGSP